MVIPLAIGLGQNGAVSQVQSWQIQCRRCGWANSGAEVRCMKCGFQLPQRPGMLIAGESAAAKIHQEAPTKVAQPGGFFPRLIAFLIDWSILGAVGVVLFFVWQAALTPTSIDPRSGLPELFQDQVRQRGYLLIGLLLIRRLYFQGSWTILGASPGMRVLNLHIVQQDGEPVGFRRAYIRYMFLYGIFSILSFIASPFMVALSKRKQGLHDGVAGTYVIQYLDPEKVLAQHEKKMAATSDGAGATTPVVSAPGASAPIPAAPAAGPTSGAAAALMTAAASPAVLSQPAPSATPLPASAPPDPATVAPAAASPPQAAPPPTFDPVPVASSPAVAPPPDTAPTPAPPIDPVPREAAPSPPLEPPPPAPVPEAPPAREIYSPPTGAEPPPAAIAPYPLPFGPAPPDLPPPAPPPRPPHKTPES
jgi:uncharacterized RDD family membrane protein YckC